MEPEVPLRFGLRVPSETAGHAHGCPGRGHARRRSGAARSAPRHALQPADPGRLQVAPAQSGSPVSESPNLAAHAARRLGCGPCGCGPCGTARGARAAGFLRDLLLAVLFGDGRAEAEGVGDEDGEEEDDHRVDEGAPGDDAVVYDALRRGGTARVMGAAAGGSGLRGGCVERDADGADQREQHAQEADPTETLFENQPGQDAVGYNWRRHTNRELRTGAHNEKKTSPPETAPRGDTNDAGAIP